MAATAVRIRALAAGEVADVDPATAEILVTLGAAVLLDERDAPRLREALEANNARIAREARSSSGWGDR